MTEVFGSKTLEYYGSLKWFIACVSGVCMFMRLPKNVYVIVYREESLECSEHGRATVTGAG